MKYSLKLFLLLGCIWLWQAYSFPVFAAETADSISKSIQEIVAAVLNFLARGWVIPATIAGKLMTNELVYGKAIHMANFMRRVWTIMRQLANYAVGLIFLYQIFKTIVTGEEVSKLKDTLFSVVKATLLINISWFAIAALVDLSIVGVAAVGAIPATVLETQWDGIKNKFMVPSEFVISRDDTKLLGYDLTKSWTGEFALGDIIPQADNVSGPLFFLGVSVFSMFDIPYIDPEVTTRSTITLDSLLKLFIIGLFTIPLIILSIVNMMRIFRLWIVIMLSPILALDWAFKLGVGDKAEGKGKELFKPSELFALIFQPVVTVAALWLCLILIIGIHQVVLGWSEQSLADIAKVLCLTVDSAKESTIDCNGASFTKVIWGGFGGLMLHLLLALLASFLLWMIVKLSLNFSSITAGVAKWMYDFSESALGAVPIPGTEMFWWDRVWFNAARQFWGDVKDDYERKFKKWIWWWSNQAVEDLLNKTYSTFWIDRPPSAWNDDQKLWIRKSIRDYELTPQKSLVAIRDIVKDSPKTFQQIQEPLNQWLAKDRSKDWLKVNNLWIITEESITSWAVYSNPKFLWFIDALFSGSDIAAAVKIWVSTRIKPSNMDKKVYPKK